MRSVVTVRHPPSSVLPDEGALLQPTPLNADLVAQDLLASIGLSTASTTGAISNSQPIAPLVVNAWHVMGVALVQWCGPFAYYAVLARAVRLAQVAVPAVEQLRVLAPPAVTLEGFEDIKATHGDALLLAGVHALLAAVITILDRVIGEELAIRVVSDALRPLLADGFVTSTRTDTEL